MSTLPPLAVVSHQTGSGTATVRMGREALVEPCPTALQIKTFLEALDQLPILAAWYAQEEPSNLVSQKRVWASKPEETWYEWPDRTRLPEEVFEKVKPFLGKGLITYESPIVFTDAERREWEGEDRGGARTWWSLHPLARSWLTAYQREAILSQQTASTVRHSRPRS